MLTHLKLNKFTTHLLAFSLMIGASLGLVFSAQQADSPWTWPLLGIFALANLMAIVNK